jgi:hypothetical protein
MQRLVLPAKHRRNATGSPHRGDVLRHLVDKVKSPIRAEWQRRYALAVTQELLKALLATRKRRPSSLRRGRGVLWASGFTRPGPHPAPRENPFRSAIRQTSGSPGRP